MKSVPSLLVEKASSVLKTAKHDQIDKFASKCEPTRNGMDLNDYIKIQNFVLFLGGGVIVVIGTDAALAKSEL